MSALLTVAEMAEADRLAVASGVPSLTLMEHAGAAVADAVRLNYAFGPVLVLCGPGNNGGDGFVAARLLDRAGWPVRLVLLGERAALKGDAAAMAQQWRGLVLTPEQADFSACDVIVDALYGAGLSRAPEGMAAQLIAAANASGKPIVAVDLPSGLHGDDGKPLGLAIRADRTITFFRLKPGHLLLPGRVHCGAIALADIGISAGVLDSIKPRQARNEPGLWQAVLPRPRLDGHKYARGHVLVRGGRQAGAARLAARGALRIGAGLCTIASPDPLHGPPDALMRTDDFIAALNDPRRNALLLGPGNGTDAETRAAVLAALKTRRACVLDADALSVFADDPAALFAAIQGPAVLTPHDGEFARLFPDIAAETNKLARARQAAARAKAVLVLKGADTVIASPDGFAVINDNAPPDLATAGAGDVLAGFCAGLMAQGMKPLMAASAAVWLHGAAASESGPGLIADDLPEALRPVLRRLRQ
ncbi:NAD(P)H-hydrate dehydratase [Ferrovibrio sp. MS7]|uniref:NAD(P)H-hydrate dehydratase n=1 Tax=Ferrovibrio plantarum TaxID=3119164 RepID=UPI0031352FEB